MQYDFLPNSPQLHSSANATQRSKLPLILGTGTIILVLFLAGTGFAIHKSSSKDQAQSTDATASLEQSQTKPLAQAPAKGVAGVSAQAEKNDDSVFAAVPAVTRCVAGTIFSIGQPEVNQNDNPADELNWSGTLEVLPKHPNPFVVGVNTDDEFPWRTAAGSAQPVAIQFSLPQDEQRVQMEISWSPGKSSQKMLSVLLDDIPVSHSEIKNGDWADGAWEQLPLTTDTFSFSANSGSHTLTLVPNLAGGDPIVWDYITVASVCP